MTYKTADDTQNTFARLLKGVAVGVPIGIAAALIFALIFCAVLLRMPDPMAAIEIFAAAALYIGAFAASLIPSLMFREGAFPAAFLGAGLYCLTVFAASLFLRDPSGAASVFHTVIGYAGCAISALLSGLIARPRAVRIKAGKKSPAAIARAKLGRRR